jgi:glycosyltransferase involved in cell wall biosynthesis
MTDSKKTILMLAGHEPSLDPRIQWEAQSASRVFNVIVHGLKEPHIEKDDLEIISDTYCIKRFARPSSINVPFSLKLVKELFVSHSIIWQIPLFAALVICAVAVSVLDLIIIAGSLIFLALRSLEATFNKAAGKTFVVGTIYRYIRQKCLNIALKLVNPLNRGLKDFFWHTLYFLKMAQVFYDSYSAEVKVDIVHCNDLSTLLTGALIKAKNKDVQIVYDAHECYPHAFPDAPWLQTWAYTLLEQKLLPYVDQVITVSSPLATYMEQTYSISNVVTIPNAEPWKEQVSGKETAQLDAMAGGRIKILYQGNFAAQRGLEEILDEWQAVDHGKAALFLRGPDNYNKQEITKKANDLGFLGKSVFILNAVTEDELVDAASQADIGLIPYKPVTLNYKYCCPNKLSQYLHAGVVVLANNLPYVNSILETCKTGLTYDSNIKGSFATIINKIAVDRDQLEALKKNALIAGKNHFNWQAFEGELLEIYKKAA